MLIEGADYFVRYTEFPKDSGNTHGMVLLNDDGTYSVYIDKAATYEQRMKSLKHEIEHIAGEDLHGEKDIRKIERSLPKSAVVAEKLINAKEEQIDESRGYFDSWRFWMEWCRREMMKKGIEPMMYGV